MKLSDRINQIEASGTVKFTNLIQQLRGQGRAIIDLAVGEPPYDTPGAVLEATKQLVLSKEKKIWLFWIQIFVYGMMGALFYSVC